MIKLINIITQNIILLGCCAISIFILFVLITFIKNVDDLAAITKQPRDSGKPDRMQSLNYMQYQYHRSVWYDYCKHYLNSV